MTNEELTKFLYFMNEEYGDRGWDAGKGPPDMYGNRAISSQEGWSDILKDQLKLNQFNDLENLGLLDNREDVEQVLRSRLVDNPDFYRINFLPTAKSMMRTNGVPVEESNLGFSSSTVHAPQRQALESSSTFVPAASAPLALEAGPSGYASLDAMSETTLPYPGEGISESLAADTATSGSSAWGGPATFAANQALNLIPTRDRKKKVTPFGDEGSVSGILKGTGKGALLGATIGSYVAPGAGTLVGGLIGGGAGLIGGSQGYFDSTSAPIINMSRIKRRGGGMQGGLLGGGSMYG
tara:strand:+ start:1134 stop:2018 length:885 start_codon:yes stop_codon:yes gene_type:complete